MWFLTRIAVHRSSVERRLLVQQVRKVFIPEEIYLANTIIALFQFYNTWVDLHGVQELTPEGYEASGVRLAAHGYK